MGSVSCLVHVSEALGNLTGLPERLIETRTTCIPKLSSCWKNVQRNLDLNGTRKTQLPCLPIRENSLSSAPVVGTG